MDNSPSPASYLVSASHRTAHLHVQQHPLTHCHPTLPFVQVARKPPFAFHSPALDLTGQTMASPHPFQLNLNDNLFSITHCRPASSCQPVPSELGLHLSTGTGQKGERCPGPPDQNSMSPWPLPTGAGRPPGITASRPWPKVAGLTPEVFLPGGDTRPYNGFLLEPTDSGPSFSPDVEVFNTAALSVVPTPIIVTDTPRRDQPQDVAVYFSGSESDSGLEPDDERSIVRGTRQDQWTSISTASPRTKSPDVTLSRRSASFLATQVPSARICPPAASSYYPSFYRK
ncbi:hypothetical protein BC827DRAFT_387006 [Russula dissimulans]|nr:hypothetical protein BC827DRAFT_387006 [Russula dissimulans]